MEVGMHSNWKIWVNTNTERNALNLLKRVGREMSVETRNVRVEPYHKGGHVVMFEVEHSEKNWNDLVVEVIELGQRIGYGWQLRGRIIEDPTGDSSKTRISGVDAIEWSLQRPTIR